MPKVGGDFGSLRAPKTRRSWRLGRGTAALQHQSDPVDKYLQQFAPGPPWPHRRPRHAPQHDQNGEPHDEPALAGLPHQMPWPVARVPGVLHGRVLRLSSQNANWQQRGSGFLLCLHRLIQICPKSLHISGDSSLLLSGSTSISFRYCSHIARRFAKAPCSE